MVGLYISHPLYTTTYSKANPCRCPTMVNIRLWALHAASDISAIIDSDDLGPVSCIRSKFSTEGKHSETARHLQVQCLQVLYLSASIDPLEVQILIQIRRLQLLARSARALTSVWHARGLHDRNPAGGHFDMNSVAPHTPTGARSFYLRPRVSGAVR